MVSRQYEVALNILHAELDIEPVTISRFTTGYCHSVYHVKTETDECVLRITSKENKDFYFGSIKWLPKLYQLNIPVPKILKYGPYEDVYYAFMTYIDGKDLGDVYHALTETQKQDIIKDLFDVQKKVSTLPSIKKYGYEDYSFGTWIEYLESLIERSRKRIAQNNIFDTDVCEKVSFVIRMFQEYLLNVEPLAFLDDITTKNVLIHEGKLVGIVDVDAICYGDSLLTIGLTNMALLAMNTDTKYIDFWLDELKASSIQRKIVEFYTLLFCIDFMGEQGMRFDNGKIIPVKQEMAELLNSIYHALLGNLC